MASSDKKRKSKQSYKPGKGGARMARARRAAVRTKSKIKRWKRYQAEVEANTRLAPTDPTRWDTTKLESHLSNLQGIVKLGKTG